MSIHPTPFTHSRDSTLVDSPLFASNHSRNPSNMSTISSSFMYAPRSTSPDDTTTAEEDAVLSFYFDPQPDPSEYRIPYKPLLRYIARGSGLVGEFRDRVSDVVKMLVRIGDLLFPPTYLLNEEVKRKVLRYTTWIEGYLEAVVGYLQRRIDGVDEAFCGLPSPALDKEHLALSIARWTEVVESLHTPTNCESYIFREISHIFSSHVYGPFLQLHRIEPGHNMWIIEPQFTSISILLRQASMLAARADEAVRSIEEEFELTMSDQSEDTKSDADSGVLGQLKRHHTPSKSAPVLLARNIPRLSPPPRQRENTI